MSEDVYLKLSHVNCGYADGFAVRDISLEISRGTVCGIIGPNGSGKTTILRAVSASMALSSGSIEIDGMSISKMSRLEIARKMAIVMQDSNFPFDMTVLEYVLLGRIPHRKGISFADSADDLKIAKKMLDTSGAANFAERNLNELSGGERQLVHIARALAQEPSILFLDEPTNHLDLSHQHQIMCLMKRLSQANNIAVGVVIHDLNLAARFCDILYLICEGKIHSLGSPEQILRPEILEPIYGVKIASCFDPINGKPLIFTPL